MARDEALGTAVMGDAVVYDRGGVSQGVSSVLIVAGEGFVKGSAEAVGRGVRESGDRSTASHASPGRRPPP